MRAPFSALAAAAHLAGCATLPAEPPNGEPRLQIVETVSPTAAVRREASGERSAYLMSYFKDATHSLYFATSRDGYIWADINSGEPILSGYDIADQHGIRDPHIIRGADGAFYLTMTDLHIFGQREGYRDTEWERPGDQYGWGNNRNLVFMKSYDLVHWTHALVPVSELFPRYANAGNMWAPQSIMDPDNGRMMVYFTTRDGASPNYMVSSYANEAFDTLATEPQQILNYPDPSVNTIDADITRVGDTWHMFYVAHDAPGNIREAHSQSINSGYVTDRQKVDPEERAAEAPNLWRRYGTDTYVLMYDVFGVDPHNMGFAETTDFEHFTNLGRFNEPGSPMRTTNFSSPKHGSVMPITLAEAERVERWFAR
ncbi:glycoside hydrolase family 43 protein [Aurantiacibacter luteus]|uniref:Beta-xylosidase n=1 Tax=Aurantiacibacter luteus TaxID=1581420 RepID=A0A0G9MYS6_9SPHN|nr:glycoside hydrolase family 43 protein [Aurantiacibacter luteus]KLE35937.1 beta-xylosidase [Aurantiacibacter luteus]